MFFEITESSRAVGEELVAAAFARFGSAGLERDRFALTLLLHPAPLSLESPADAVPEGYSCSGSRPFYPCSVVKMFYLVAVQAAIEAGRIQEHDELDRAMRDMILWSSNTATNYIIDLVTDTTGDTLLDTAAFGVWADRRGAVNRFFRELGHPVVDGINVCQKLMDDERYGREKIFVSLGGNNHNRLTSDASAWLLHGIMSRRMVTERASARMIRMLARPLDADFVSRPGAQVTGFLGGGLPVGARLWSKAGWTGWTGDPNASYRRHDAAYVELPDRCAFTLAVFTEGEDISQNLGVLPDIGRLACEILAGR